jgi:hypothetical protein
MWQRDALCHLLAAQLSSGVLGRAETSMPSGSSWRPGPFSPREPHQVCVVVGHLDGRPGIGAPSVVRGARPGSAYEQRLAATVVMASSLA